MFELEYYIEESRFMYILFYYSNQAHNFFNMDNNRVSDECSLGGSEDISNNNDESSEDKSNNDESVIVVDDTVDETVGIPHRIHKPSRAALRKTKLGLIDDFFQKKRGRKRKYKRQHGRRDENKQSKSTTSTKSNESHIFYLLMRITTNLMRSHKSL